MCRKYSIGFLIFLIFFMALVISYYKNPNEEKSESFYLKDKEGYVVVYDENDNLYEYTSIKSSDLPDSLQEGLLSGIILEDLSELYGFLENYSS